MDHKGDDGEDCVVVNVGEGDSWLVGKGIETIRIHVSVAFYSRGFREYEEEERGGGLAASWWMA